MATEPRVSFAIFNGLVPRGGPRALRIALDFTALASQPIDLQEELLMAQLEFVQTLYIDNQANANALICVVGATQQIIKVKGNTEGYYSVLAPETAGFTFSTTLGAVIVPIHFINVPMAVAQWATV